MPAEPIGVVIDRPFFFIIPTVKAENIAFWGRAPKDRPGSRDGIYKNACSHAKVGINELKSWKPAGASLQVRPIVANTAGARRQLSRAWRATSYNIGATPGLPYWGQPGQQILAQGRLARGLDERRIGYGLKRAAREGWEELDLSSRFVESLPQEIGQLANLQTLQLTRNRLTTLPEAIGRLVDLRTLILTGNQLTALPESIGQMAALEHLDLDNNPLNPALQRAYDAGLDELRAYLRNLE